MARIPTDGMPEKLQKEAKALIEEDAWVGLYGECVSFPSSSRGKPHKAPDG